MHNAIVWQDRRTASMTAALRRDGHEPMVQQKTGLLLDPYFSGSKLAWLLENVDGARERAEAGKLAFGTIDSWLIWKLTGGKRHVTDATNAARTLLYNIREGRWDDDILKLLNIPASLLPEVLDTGADFGTAETALFGDAIPILGVAGDQQAATLGQACFDPGMLKSTYGTGCFALLNTGDTLVESRNRLLGTIAYQFDGKPTYALEGSIFIAGAVVQWLRDGAADDQDRRAKPEPCRNRRPVAGALPRAGLHRPRRALLGPRLPGRDLRADAQFGPGRDRAGRTRIRGLPDPRPVGSHGGRLGGRGRVERAARRWRHDGVGLDDAVLADMLGARWTGPRCSRTHGAGRGLGRGHACGRLSRLRRIRAGLAVERTFTPQMDTATREARYAGWKDAVRGARLRTVD